MSESGRALGQTPAETRKSGETLDEDAIRFWRYQAAAVPAVPQDRLWPNRCEALASALLDARAEVERLRDALEQVRDADFADSEIPDFIRSVLA